MSSPKASMTRGEAVFVVGSGEDGQMGMGSDRQHVDRLTELLFVDGNNVEQCVAGGMSTLLLTYDGSVSCQRYYCFLIAIAIYY